MHDELSLKEVKKEWHGTLKSYAIGFTLSLVLTSISFLLVITRIISGRNLTLSIAALALVQAIGQMLFFLHLGQEPKPRWESVIFYFMLLLLLVVVLGSLWIMYDLNDRVMMDM